MRDTRIVFIGIGLLVVLPLLFQMGKHIWFAAKGRNVKYLWMRLLALLAVSLAVVLLVISLYRFTLGYQAPLVVEQFHELFIERVDKNISLKEYLSALEKKDLVVSDFTFVKDEDIKNSGLIPGEYSVAISENIYENDDGSVTLYTRYQRDDAEIYTALTLKMDNSRWRAVEHRILTGDDLEEAGLQKRFYEIEVGS
jgi:hypothetical protein